MNTRPLFGLAGVVFAVAFSEMNDQVVALALPDIGGSLGLDQDAVSWFRTIYLMGYILGATIGPSLAVIFSPRPFLLFSVALACFASLLTPLSSWLPLLDASRFIQGVAEGMIICNLLAVALRSLPGAIRLYGLVFYALTATVIPSMATTLVALWTDVVDDWRFIFLQSVPLAVIAAVLIWYGLPEQPPQPQKLKHYDWLGVVSAFIGFGALAVFFGEGDRFDWFNSPMTTVCLLLGAVFTPLFLWRETQASDPLMGLYLLKRRNLLYSITALMIFIVVGLSSSAVPVNFLEQVKGYRPAQAHWLTLEIALSQFLLLPFTAWLLDFEWADARGVGAIGMLSVLGACAMGTTMNSDWTREQFFLMQGLQAVGQSFVVMTLLMIATNNLKPEEGPYGSALVNAPRALAEAVGAGLLAFIARVRGGLHRDSILGHLGANRIGLSQLGRIPSSLLHPQPGQTAPGGAALRSLDGIVRQQTTTLVTIDTYVVLGTLVVGLLILQLTLPTRTQPPRLALAAHG